MRVAPNSAEWTSQAISFAWPGYMRAKPAQHNADAATGPVMLTIAEASAMLKVSKWAIYQLIRSRQLATVKIRSRRLVPQSALEALVEKLTIEALT